MATWGIVNTSVGYAYGEYTYTQDPTKKETYVNTYVRFKRYGGSSGSLGMTGQIQIGGNFYRGTATADLSTAGTTTIITKSYTIKHLDDGSVPTGVGLQFAFSADGATTYSQHKTFDEIIPKIKVGTKITNNSTKEQRIDFGKSVSFTLNKPVSTYTADVYYKIGETEYQIKSATSDTTINYIFLEKLIENFPDTSEPIITVYCKTIETNIVEQTDVYLYVPDTYAPKISLIIADKQADKPIDLAIGMVWVQNKSILQGKITADGASGATITNYLSSLSDFDQVYTTNPFLTQALTVTGERTITSTVTDSRGKTSTVTQKIIVTPYQAPAIVNTKVERCFEDGTVSNIGTHAKVSCKYKISPLENKNTKKLTVQLDGGEEIEIPITNYEGEASYVAFDNISQSLSYNVKFNLTDLYGTTPQEHLLGIAYMTESKLAGGKGITFGQVATEEGLHSYMDSYFHKKIEGLYRIGDIIITLNEEDPKYKFGGTWEKIEDAFLIGAGSNYKLGSTGGEKEVTLKAEEIPSHTHPQAWNGGDGNKNPLVTTANINNNKTGGCYYYGQKAYYQWSNPQSWLDTYASGGGKAHNNMPPYLAVYMWKRIA